MMRALWIAAGAIVWALHFTIIYGYTALACARGMSHTVPWVAGATTLVAVALAIAIIVKGYTNKSEFIDWMTATVAALALGAIVMETFGLLLVPACV